MDIASLRIGKYNRGFADFSIVAVYLNLILYNFFKFILKPRNSLMLAITHHLLHKHVDQYGLMLYIYISRFIISLLEFVLPTTDYLYKHNAKDCNSSYNS